MLSEISWVAHPADGMRNGGTSAPGSVVRGSPESGRTPTAYETPRGSAPYVASGSNGGGVAWSRGRATGAAAAPGAHRRLVVIVVAHELGADERLRVVLAQVEVTQFGQVVAERLVHLLADAGHRGPDPLDPRCRVLGQVGQPVGAEDEERGEGRGR